MKYIEVETPYGLQKYPAYGIGGFIKNVLGGLKKVAKKVAPILPLALSFAPGSAISVVFVFLWKCSTEQ